MEWSPIRVEYHAVGDVARERNYEEALQRRGLIERDAPRSSGSYDRPQTLFVSV
jgi:hypothetical protein